MWCERRCSFFHFKAIVGRMNKCRGQGVLQFFANCKRNFEFLFWGSRHTPDPVDNPERVNTLHLQIGQHFVTTSQWQQAGYRFNPLGLTLSEKMFRCLMYGVPFVKICEVNGGNACMTCQV